MHKIEQSEGFLGTLLGPLLKNGLPLTANLFKPLAKSFLIPLGITAAASATDAALHKKMFGYCCPSDVVWMLLSHSRTTTLIISNEEMNDIMKIVKSHEEYGLLRKGMSQTIKNEAKE